MKKLKPIQYKQAIEQAHTLAGSRRLKALHVAQAVNQLCKDGLSSIKPFTPPTLPYQLGDLVTINCVRTVSEPYAKYNGCWAQVKEVLTHGCIVLLIGQEWNIHKERLEGDRLCGRNFEATNPARYCLTKSVRNSLGMEREILERALSATVVYSLANASFANY